MRRSTGNEVPKIVNADSLSNDLEGLEKFTNYCVHAEAFNSKGNSNKTNTTCLSTDEDGMFKLIINTLRCDYVKKCWQLIYQIRQIGLTLCGRISEF